MRPDSGKNPPGTVIRYEIYTEKCLADEEIVENLNIVLRVSPRGI